MITVIVTENVKIGALMRLESYSTLLKVHFTGVGSSKYFLRLVVSFSMRLDTPRRS